MKVKDIMTTNVVTLNAETTLAEIKKLFDQKKFHHVLVVENENKLVGIISDRDVLKQLSPFIGTFSEDAKSIHTLNKKAHQIMSRNLVCISKEISVQNAATKILKENVSCLPVVNEKNQLEGVLTWRDILRIISHH